MRGAASLAFLVLSVACADLLQIPDQETLAFAGAPGAGSGLSDPSAACNPEADTDECFRCTDQNCCPQYLACHTDPRCGDFFQKCIPDCTATGTSYSACVVQCDGQYGGGHAVFAPYHACGQLHCLAPCLNKPPDACTACLYASCGDVAAACIGDRDCDTLLSCLIDCKERQQPDQCAAACKEGASKQAQNGSTAELTCGLTYCQDACSGSLPF
jgi:hypothetical protein